MAHPVKNDYSVHERYDAILSDFDEAVKISCKQSKYQKPRRMIRKSNLNPVDLVAAALKGAGRYTGKDYAAEILQHVTSEEECKSWIQVVKSQYMDNGELDRKGYHRALNKVLDNMQGTIDELKRGEAVGVLDDTEVLIKQYERNAELIRKEIRATRER